MSKKKDYIWNTAAGLVNASESVIMSMIVTRTTGLIDTGILTIAFAVGNLLMAIGKYGMRNFQVTDLVSLYSFSDYFISRVITVFTMAVCTAGYMVYSAVFLGYDCHKLICVSLICMIYMLESLEDVFWGYYQQKGFLAVGAKMFCIRWCVILLSFGVTIMIGRNMVLALIVSFVCSVCVFAIMAINTFTGISGGSLREQVIFSKAFAAQKSLLRVVFPFCGMTFLSFYVLNSPKYAIDACMDSQVQACYGFVAMPVFVIGLLNGFIYQPTLVGMADEWDKGLKAAFRKRILRQSGILILLTVICLVGAYVLGIPVLSWLYHTDLTDYKAELLILLLAGGFLAESGYLGVILTIMRRQKCLLGGYAATAAAAFFCMRIIVFAYGTIGVAVAYCLLMVMLCAIYVIMLLYYWKKNSGSNQL